MKLRGSEVCVKQDHFTHGSCSTPGSTTWWSRPFYCEKIRSNPQPLWSILWFFSENRTFWGVFKLCFSSYFQNLLNFAIFVEFGLIMLIFTNIFWIFEGSKHAILSKNHRQGSRTWWSRPFYCEKIRSNPQPLWSILWFFSENRTFWGVFKLCFSSYFQNLLNFAIFVEFGLIMLIFTNIFWIFEGSKHAILSKNHRQGSRSGSRSRAWTKTFFWCILKRDKDSKNPGFPFSFENCSFTSL